MIGPYQIGKHAYPSVHPWRTDLPLCGLDWFAFQRICRRHDADGLEDDTEISFGSDPPC